MKKNNGSLVSIIIPAYNASKTIKRCVASVVEQTYRSIEILVVDDGSEDDTLPMISNFNDSRIKVFQKHHAGVSQARNFGLSKSKGEYVLFVDSDDTIEQDAIALLVQYMDKDKDVDALKFGYFTVKNGECKKIEMPRGLCDRIFDMKKNVDYELLLDLFFRKKKTIPCYSVTLFFRKAFFDNNKIRFNEKLYMMEDAVFYLDLFNSNARLCFVPDSLYSYYVNQDSVTKSIYNYGKTASGALDSCSIILDRLNYPVIASNKYFKIIFEYISKNYAKGESLGKLVFDNKYKRMAVVANGADDKVFWKMAKRAVIKRREKQLKILAYIYAFRSKIKELV